VNEEPVKKPLIKRKAVGQVDAGQILPEYSAASRYAAGGAVVVPEPDGAAAFPSSEEANEALRALAGIIVKGRSRRRKLRRDFEAASFPADTIAAIRPNTGAENRTIKSCETSRPTQARMPVPHAN